MVATTTMSAPGQEPHEAAHDEEGRQRQGADRKRGAADVAELAHGLPQAREGVAGVDVDPEELRELCDHERDRDAVQVPHQHGPGEVVRDPAEPEQPRQPEARRDEQREHRGELGRVVAPGDGHREHGGRDERRGRAFGADHEPSRRAEQDVRDGRQQERVEPVDRRQPCELPVRHRGGQRERRDRQPCEEVATRARGPVARQLPGDGDRASEQRLLARGPERTVPPVAARAGCGWRRSLSVVSGAHSARRPRRGRRRKLLIPAARRRDACSSRAGTSG